MSLFPLCPLTECRSFHIGRLGFESAGSELDLASFTLDGDIHIASGPWPKVRPMSFSLSALAFASCRIGTSSSSSQFQCSSSQLTPSQTRLPVCLTSSCSKSCSACVTPWNSQFFVKAFSVSFFVSSLVSKSSHHDDRVMSLSSTVFFQSTKVFHTSGSISRTVTSCGSTSAPPRRLLKRTVSLPPKPTMRTPTPKSFLLRAPRQSGSSARKARSALPPKRRLRRSRKALTVVFAGFGSKSARVLTFLPFFGDFGSDFEDFGVLPDSLSESLLFFFLFSGCLLSSSSSRFCWTCLTATLSMLASEILPSSFLSR
mmetsp:Transcript_3590/g.7253  ORF Transcript_3590/g.7253 Transcript_3590/m.7253 type:complete len:314 (+) Transcript_3590:250-1191(+)